MKKLIEFEIDETIAEQAESIYNSLGMDTEMALCMFMRRTVLEKGLPFNVNSTAAAVSSAPVINEVHIPASTRAYDEIYQPARKTPRVNNTITDDMIEKVWDVFLECQKNDWGPSYGKKIITEETGMTEGSAFIYLVILESLVNGKPNKRNMKMNDLEYFMRRIKNELGSKAYENALKSLRGSIEYWDKPQFGKFAQRVQEFLNEQ